MTCADEELTPPGRIHWLIGVLDHDLTNDDLTMPADELASRYVEDCGWLLEELTVTRRTLAGPAAGPKEAPMTETRYSRVSGMDRLTLEQYAIRQQAEADHLRNELAVAMRALTGLTEAVFDVAQKAVAAHQLGEMLTNDQGEPE